MASIRPPVADRMTERDAGAVHVGALESVSVNFHSRITARCLRGERLVEFDDVDVA